MPKKRSANEKEDKIDPSAYKALEGEAFEKVWLNAAARHAFAQVFEAVYKNTFETSTCLEEAFERAYKEALKETIGCYEAWY